jgi:hypothetical protein
METFAKRPEGGRALFPQRSGSDSAGGERRQHMRVSAFAKRISAVQHGCPAPSHARKIISNPKVRLKEPRDRWNDWQIVFDCRIKTAGKEEK